jgi:hypothetical protein
VFGRTGAVEAESGDYSVADITGAAPLDSPNFTGVPTAPTAASGTDTTQIATTAFVQDATFGAGWVLNVTESIPDAPVTAGAFDFPGMTANDDENIYVGWNFWGYGNNSGGVSPVSGATFVYDNPSGATNNYYCYSVDCTDGTFQPSAANDNDGSDNCGVISALFTYPGSTVSEVAVTSASGTGLDTLSITTVNEGDLIVACITMDEETAVTDVTCTLVADGFKLAVAAQSSANAGQDGEIWYGVATSAGTADLVVTPTSSGYSAIVEMEFTHS